MSCTLMYQPYAMSYSSSCDRPSASDKQKLFKFPHVPSPPDSSHSSSYSGHSSSASSNIHIPLLAPPTPNTLSLSLSSPSLGLHSAHPHHHHHHNISPGNRSLGHHTQHHHHHSTSNPHNSRRALSPASGPSATITSASQSQSQQNSRSRSSSSSTVTGSNGGSGGHSAIIENGEEGTIIGSGNDLHHHHQHHRSSSGSGSSSAPGASSSSTPTSHIHHQTQQHHNNNESQSTNQTPNGSSGRAQYLSANCVVYENYDADSSRMVDEHFSRALTYASTSVTPPAAEKPSKSLPMSTRNFPPSFWNSAYQPPTPKHLTGYGAAPGAGEFYGSAMDYGTALAAHHHQTDPWHYPLASHHHHHHQSYHHHHRAAELAYPSMPSTSRFTPAQYGSFLFPGAAAAVASTAAARFIPGSSQCGVKGETGHWGAGGRYHPHPHESTWSDFHLADYSAAAAHYSNMTAAAGLDFESHYLQSS